MIISEGRRLAYYQTKADSKFWDSHWSSLANKVGWGKAEKGFLGWFEKPFIKYLPQTGQVLEAGCGLGYYVLALGQRGYEIEGVEWSRQAVSLIKQSYPKLKVRIGDVRKLAVKDGYYSGYISLGVVEHDRSGPQDYLREAARVLKPGGVAFISVPHFNLLRKIKNWLGSYAGDYSGLDFYQFAFARSEIDRLIKRAGFKIIDHFHYDAYKGLRDEIPILKKIITNKRLNQRLGASNLDKIKSGNEQRGLILANRSLWLRALDYLFGHMTMVICIKA